MDRPSDHAKIKDNFCASTVLSLAIVAANPSLAVSVNPMYSRKHFSRSQAFWSIVLAVGISVAALRPKLETWIPVGPPSPEIEQMAIATTMTPDAQQIFYRQAPTIESKQTFYTVCKRADKTEQVSDTFIMFGCYLSNGKSGKIAIRSVADARFQGVMEMTAAHEMLHAAYTRLSPAEKEELKPRLKQAASRVKNRRLANVLKRYEKIDEALYVNELHSHLGTELADLGDAELENHYQRYFRDRAQVVALADQSQAVVTQLDEKAKQLKGEIDALEADLKQTKQSLEAGDRDLDAQQQDLEIQRANLMNFKDQAEQSIQNGSGSPALVGQFDQMKSDYNAQVQAFNGQIQQHQDNVAAFKIRVDEYKQKVDAYNEIANEERSLFADLKSPPANMKPPVEREASESNLPTL